MMASKASTVAGSYAEAIVEHNFFLKQRVNLQVMVLRLQAKSDTRVGPDFYVKFSTPLCCDCRLIDNFEFSCSLLFAATIFSSVRTFLYRLMFLHPLESMEYQIYSQCDEWYARQ